MSIGKLFGDGCTDILTATTMKVHKQGELVLEGNYNGEAGMWQVKLIPPQGPNPTHQPENTLMSDRTKPELAQLYHGTLFIPIKNTLI